MRLFDCCCTTPDCCIPKPFPSASPPPVNRIPRPQLQKMVPPQPAPIKKQGSQSKTDSPQSAPSPQFPAGRRIAGSEEGHPPVFSRQTSFQLHVTVPPPATESSIQILDTGRSDATQPSARTTTETAHTVAFSVLTPSTLPTRTVTPVTAPKHLPVPPTPSGNINGPYSA